MADWARWLQALLPQVPKAGPDEGHAATGAADTKPTARSTTQQFATPNRGHGTASAKGSSSRAAPRAPQSQAQAGLLGLHSVGGGGGQLPSLSLPMLGMQAGQFTWPSFGGGGLPSSVPNGLPAGVLARLPPGTDAAQGAAGGSLQQPSQPHGPALPASTPGWPGHAARGQPFSGGGGGSIVHGSSSLGRAGHGCAPHPCRVSELPLPGHASPWPVQSGVPGVFSKPAGLPSPSPAGPALPARTITGAHAPAQRTGHCRGCTPGLTPQRMWPLDPAWG